MNILVYDVAAETGGALSVLNDFYEEAKLCKDINWFFVISNPKLKETNNIKVLRFPWIKKNRFFRFYFDNIIAPILVKKNNIKKVISLQNEIVPHINNYQIVYIHNSLPFVDYKFTLKENKLLWIYQNIIGKNIIKSIKKSNKVIVQTKWMKKACIKKTKIKSKKIDIVTPQINININEYFEPNNNSIRTFFYPASGVVFKNHKVIVEACKMLKKGNIQDFKVILTLTGDENEHISQLYKEVKEKQLPIEFIGKISRYEVFDLYTKSILLFPSYIESFGLPMLEARLHKTIIFAANCPFSNEILDGYNNAYFFDPFNFIELKNLMEKIIMNDIEYKECHEDIGYTIENRFVDLLNELY